MDTAYLLELTAWSGIAAFVIAMIEIPFWFIYPGDPPYKNIVTRTFISLFVQPAMLMFSAGLALLYPSAFTIFGALFMTVITAIGFVGHSIQLGAALKADRRPIDPTLVGSGAEGSLLLYGPIAHLLFVLSLGLMTTGLLVSGAAPAWLIAIGYLIASFQLVLVPTIFSKTIPARFYSLNGWNIPVSAGLFTAWILMASIYLLVR